MTEPVLVRRLRAAIPEVFVEWQTITREEPWARLAPDARLDNLNAVLLEALDAAFGADDEALARLVAAAAKHGVERRDLALPQELLFTEYYLLREAVWRVARRDDDAADALLRLADAMVRLDAALSIATRGSIFGYHRDELEAVGRWPGALHALITGSELAAGSPAGAGRAGSGPAQHPRP